MFLEIIYRYKGGTYWIPVCCCSSFDFKISNVYLFLQLKKRNITDVCKNNILRTKYDTGKKIELNCLQLIATSRSTANLWAKHWCGIVMVTLLLQDYFFYCNILLKAIETNLCCGSNTFVLFYSTDFNLLLENDEGLTSTAVTESIYLRPDCFIRRYILESC